jgi:hypothetical protein
LAIRLNRTLRMAKEKQTSAVTRLTKEELAKLTPEEQIAYAEKLAAYVESLEETNKDLTAVNEGLTEQADKLEKTNKSNQAKLKEVEAKEKKQRPVSFVVDEEPGVKGGEYEFTAPALTWDDNQVYNIRALAESKDEAEQQLFDEICAKLVQRSSGLVRRKEDK